MILWWVFVMLYLFRNTVELDPLESTPAPAIVLTLDVSESMEYRSRINKLESALCKWIEFEVSDGVRLGIVQFSSSEKVLSHLVPISKESRRQLMKLIPTIAHGETYIGLGLWKALELLESTETEGMVILITDVEDYELGQDVKDMFDEVKRARVKIVTIAMGDGTKLNDLDQLATLSGGHYYTVRDEEGVDELLTALRGALNFVRKDPPTPVTITLTDVDNNLGTNPTVETSSHNAAAITPFGEKTDVQSSDAFSLSSYHAISILVGLVIVIIGRT